MIWQTITLAFTGNGTGTEPKYNCKFSRADSSVAYGGTLPISFMVGDFNTNALMPGTKIRATMTSAFNIVGYSFTLSGMGADSDYIVPDGIPNGPTELSFVLAANCIASSCVTVSNNVTVTVSSNDIVVCAPQTITGTFHN
jgi:hypothetical protein